MTLVINIDHICENKSYSYNFCKFYKVAKASFVIPTYRGNVWKGEV